MVKRKSPVAKGEQANRAKKEKVLNGQFQFKQFFSSGQQFEKKNFSLTRARARAKSVCSEMCWNVLKCIEMEWYEMKWNDMILASLRLATAYPR